MKLTPQRESLMRVTWMYHVEGLTQEAISAEFGIPRSRVVKLLKQALDEKLVSVQLSHDYFKSLDSAAELKRAFGLKDAMVVPAPAEQSALKPALGAAGALYLSGALTDGMTIATAWGSTLLEVAKALAEQRVQSVSVVMMLGGLSRSLPALNPNDIARRVAQAVSGKMFSLFAPALVDEPALREMLLLDSNVRAPLDLVRASQLALLGAGTTLDRSTLLKTGVVSELEMQALRSKGAVGDIVARFYDVDGRPVVTPLNDRVVGIELEDLRGIPSTVLVSGGEDKVEAILGAMRGGYVNTVVTDERTARRLLRLGRGGQGDN